MTVAMVRPADDRTRSLAAANARMAADLELPRLLRLLLTVGCSLTESAGLPVAAHVVVAWLDGRDAGLVAGLAAPAGMRGSL